MGLIEQEIKEIRQLRDDWKAGKVTDSKAMSEHRFYDQTQKRINSLIQIHMVRGRFGKSVFNGIVRQHIISDGGAVDVIEAGDIELEMVKCPDKDYQLVSRADCLGYSGETEHVENCQTCEHFKITRKVLLRVA